MTIKCCNGCVAPKRHTACWGHCPEYLAEKAEHEMMKEIEDRKRKIDNDIYQQRSDRVSKAIRHHGRR